jgi:methionyl-tRNA formyltransferase
MFNIIHQSNNPVNGNGLKIVFLGTPEFALPTLETLVQSEFKPIAVFCAPDKPVGRKQTLTPPPVKILAQKYNIPVYQPKNKEELTSQLKTTICELAICVAYGIIFTKEALEMPKYGFINIHPSLLPKYRGPSPIQAAILAGDRETGVTIFKVTEQVDAGPIIKNKKLNIENQKYTTPELSGILAKEGADLLLKILPDYLSGKIQPQSQDDSRATYTKIIKKEDGKINWQKSAVEIERQVRAYFPWPSSHTTFNNQILKIIKANISTDNLKKQIGEVFLDKNNELSIQTKQKHLIIKELQLEGKKPMSAQDFLRGHQEIIGKIIG